MELPRHYLITPAADDPAAFLVALEATLQAGTRLIQFKGKGLEPDAYVGLAREVIERAHAHGARVLLSGDPARVAHLGADGLHLDSKALKAVTARPLPAPYLLAVSGHDLESLQRGEAIGASFGVLSPIKYTKTHPDIEPLAWEGLAAVAAALRTPVYALGGVDAGDEPAAVDAGAQGIAGHRGYWKG